ncbi:glycosyltransferase [Sphingomonas naphthae]|uniref:Chitooligosaccharide deacetylase n=1 Tax=Sphingomonas naphthae TaxID=1813468 RepID=A0ABY7TQ70_9SPHN|nr:glycosyltransferase [Sphingomonas naphthae]WCT75392.1 glycosyltransferase [Sphingomonas naphthae]
MGQQPVFYDPSGRRRRRFTVSVVAFVALLLLAIAIFVGSIVETPAGRPLPFEVERPPVRSIGQLAHQEGNRIVRALRARSLLPAKAYKSQKPLAVSFHAPWDDASAASLGRHVDDLDWIVPGWLSVTGPGHKLTVFPDLAGHRIIDGASRRPKVLPMLQNAIEGEWDGKGTAALLADRVARTRLLDRLEGFLVANHADGAFFDLEDLPASAQPDYLAFLREVRARFDKRHWLMAMAVPVGDRDWNLPAYARVVDRLFLMAYDEHYPGGDPGPIASQNWFVTQVATAARGVPRDRIVVAVGSYAYDWAKSGGTDAMSVEQAWLTAHESDAIPAYDKASGNSSFQYAEGDTPHTVWMLDAASVHNQLAALRRGGFNAFALWRLGSEDPSVWQVFGRAHETGANVRAIEAIPAGTDVDIEGAGEILKVGAVPVPGFRQVDVDGQGNVADQRYIRLPLPYAIQRAGYRPGLVALTFDDGPDPNWTPRVLDVLKAKKVPATFFVVGENALANYGLLRREVAEGHEVGNHTYTHPNLGQASDRETEIELNANQRLFQAFTMRSMRLMRAPYFGDAEPTTADEIDPVLIGQRLGYLSVGLHVDPDDWKRPGVQHIIDETIAGVQASNGDRSGNVVLLHDAGGDRRQTVEALPIIIDRLRALGYRFVPVSELIGLSPLQAMPPLPPSEQGAARTDLALFTTLGLILQALKVIFFVAISLGILRAITLAGLALWQARRENRQVWPALDPDKFVSVLIPAYNEARVIERSVAKVLASTDVRIEVIVIDDGSKDDTSAIVARAFADEPRVRLLTLENGGKARALNEGLKLTNGEIVIALDADTQFEPRTIARLARWFGDPKLGAVAGNAKVGNRVNLVTRWQALEYITAQNLERRALGRLDAITVVPGAVGAWRLAAIAQAGGYPHDTLAEDQDLTIAIQRLGWTVSYDQSAIAWTEAPESFRALAKQRFRWAFGTLQCLWKHGAVLRNGQPKGLARIGLPQAILFQLVFAAISPIIDLALVASIVGTWMNVAAHGWAQTRGDVGLMAVYWLVFTAIDLLAGIVAFGLEPREKWRLLWLLVPQRIGYRQVMYYVVIKALSNALRGRMVGWGKLERSGRVGAA